MMMRLRRPWRARLVVVLAALVLAAVGTTLVWRDTPPPYQPQRWQPPHPRVAVTYESTAYREDPPGPATLVGAVMMAGALALSGGCLFIRRRQ
ncbi:hypothetical protein [Streptomyces halobius]|uniref:MYXO-CTERM domain-containing protein n=1 Tax=Streptomyces halobius TaxID=2879846 RepID=A0ABY4MBX6_9ACTN|nr:hypothetical protein [Streptomyces halobius]UQA95289.1 hypothetical protein K9S39_28615 [Streptomyces halobius]